MEFQNAGIDIEQLPKVAELQLRPIDSKYRKVLYWQWLLSWMVIFTGAAIFMIFAAELHSPFWLITIPVVLLILAGLNWMLIAKSFAYKAFAVREHDLIYRTGWLVRSTRVCPFNRIQHCSVDAGLWERKFNLSSLSVFTAGGNEADMKIPGLPESIASELRELIIYKSGASNGRI